MKTLFIFREGFESKYLLSLLIKEIPNSSIILESGNKAKKRKLARIFTKSSLLIWPVKVLDLVALQLYNYFSENYLKKHLKVRKVLNAPVVEDVNDQKCIELIKNIKPSVIIIFGTAIIKEPFLQTIKAPVFNIHTGVLPRYRNVHSEFWAYKNKDYNNIGVTIIHLDKGIDSGAIALQEKVHYQKGDSLFSLKLKNLKLITPMVLQLLKLYKSKKLPKIKQKPSDAGFYPTPAAIDLVTAIPPYIF